MGKYKAPVTPRRTLGPDYEGMVCLNCGNATVQAVLDKRGVPYIRCNMCRWRILGLDIGQVHVFRWLSLLMKDERFRAAWLRVRTAPPTEVTTALADQATAVLRPQTLEVSEPKKSEVPRG